MVKKITGIEKIIKGTSSKHITRNKNIQRKTKLPAQKPDTYESARYASETKGIEFQTQKIQFSPEDEEKMSKMSIKERIQYKRKLKKEGKYKVVEE